MERTHSHLGIGKRKKTERTKGREGYGKTEFGQDAAISVEEAIVLQSYKSRARDLDLEHTLDARSPGYHCKQVWSQSSHLCRSRSDLRKKFTDGQTDDGRRAISSWNELKTSCGPPRHQLRTLDSLTEGR